MKIFMDTADVKEIAEFADLGVVYGVTTNPSLIAKEGRDYAEKDPSFRAAFTTDGKIPAKGEVFRNPGLAGAYE